MEKKTIIPFTGYQKLLILLLALIQFTVVLDFMILSPLGDMVMKSLLITPAQFGVVVAAYAISAGTSGLFAAGFADKYDRKKILLFFYVGFVIGTLLCGLSTTHVMLLAARIVTGIFGGVISSIAMAIVSDLFVIEQRGRVMGFIQMAFAGSQVLGIPLSLALADKWSWNMPFFMIVGFAVILGIVVWMQMEPINEHLKVQTEKHPLRHLWNTVKNAEYRLGFTATALLSVGGFMLMPFGSSFLVNNVGILQSQLSFIYMLTGVSSLVVMPVIGKLSDRYSKFSLFAVGSVLSIIMVIIYTNLPVSPVWLVTVVNMILFMGIMSRMVPAMALTTSLPEMKDRGAFMSVNSSLQQYAGGIASIIAGLIVVQKSKTSPLENFQVIGLVMVVVTVLCMYFIFKVQKIADRRKADTPKVFS